jgi:ABC-type phosphate transport system auxiliary subunit
LKIKAPVFAGDVTNLRDLLNQMAVIFNSVGEKAKRLNEMAAIEKATAVDAIQTELTSKSKQLETISLENKTLQVTVQQFESRIKDLERTLAAETLLAENYQTLKEENKSLKEEIIRLTEKLNAFNE